MRLLLDTNVLIALVDERLGSLQAPMRDAITDAEAVVYASVASLWEIAIKVRLGKLALEVSPLLLPDLIGRIGLELIAIDHRHALTNAEPDPATRDPFDRLLLAQCLIENLRLVTVDRVLAAHPLAWRAAAR
jgi:PIN domain nuclease of toxin-antitoxin system